MNYPSPFHTFATAVLNQLAASLWLSLLRSFPVSDTLGLMMLEQLAFSHWATQELARKQSRDLAAGAESDSPAMLRLSRERRAECRLQAQLARQLNQHQRTGEALELEQKTSKPANGHIENGERSSNLSHELASARLLAPTPTERKSTPLLAALCSVALPGHAGG